jgi:two-component system, NtrC family, response regulator HydG
MPHQNKTHEIWDSRFLNQVMDAMADGVFTLDKKGRITSWNYAMEYITGFAASDAIGKTCAILNFSRCFGKECPANLKTCGIMKHGSSEVKECFLQHKQGHEVPVIKNANAVKDENNKVIGVVETVTDLTELNKARLKAQEATRRLREMHRLGNIIGKSHGMQQVYTAIKAAASSNATILIQGESGTGKELVAGAIHFNSDRQDRPLITVNCSALSESLLESELFGHVKGAFTGAVRDRAGRFEEAQGGTIFLDEIGEISPYIQVKLLRVLQEREIERVGESEKRKINIRIIAATNQVIFDLVRKGGFREDLYYRLKVFPIFIPPLRERKEDIPLLVNHFIDIHKQKTGKHIHHISQNAMRIIMDYHWPGNVRELENAIEHAFVLCSGDRIDVFDLPVEIRQTTYQPLTSEAAPAAPKPYSRGKKFSREELVELLDACDWNKAEVARRIGLSRTAVWKYMKNLGIPLKKPA